MKGIERMKPTQSHFLCKLALTLLTTILLAVSQVYSQSSNVGYTKQGFSMRLAFDNRGSFGKVAYPEFQGGSGPSQMIR